MTIEWLDDNGIALAEPVPPPRRPAPRRRNVVRLVLATTAVLVGIAVGFGVGRVSAPDHTTPPAAQIGVVGSVTVPVYVMTAPGTFRQFPSCVAAGRFDDVAAGTPVLISDSTQRIRGAAVLGPGRAEADHCVFAFTLSVPPADGYAIQVGNRPANALSAEDVTHPFVDLH
jgi:hypothetical protein